MRVHWTDWALLTALAGAACVAIYAAMARAMRRAVAEKQRETDRQLSAMAATVSALQARVAELGGLQVQQGESAAASAKADILAEQKQESPEAETVAVLSAAAATLLGKKARIRSVQLLPAEQSGAGTWAQQGRAFVQTSHNPRSRG
ncbi:MAG: hypothetical protein ACLP07_10635 [Terracidiphilus sp.]